MTDTSIKIHPLPSDEKSEAQAKESGQLSLDIYKTDKEIVILAPIAGVSKDDIKIQVTEDVLVIKGTRQPREQVKEERYYTRECFWGNFSRAIVLPLEADVEQISASFEQNVLEIRIPLSEKEKTKIIKIKA